MKMKKLIVTLLVSALAISELSARVIELSGTVISDNEKYLTSRFMGFIKSVNVGEGNMVKKDEVLYEIDSIDIDNKKRQALLNLQIYNAQLATVSRNYERFNRLFQKGLVSKAQVEEIELSKNTLESMVKIAQSQVDEVNSQYQYLKITAPNDGVVIKKMIKAGEMAIPGMPAIVLSDLSSLKIKTEVAESDLKSLYVGQKLRVKIPSMKTEVDGTISSIIPSSNPMTHTFTIKISFETAKKVYPGMYAKVYIRVQ
jgi:RND family efflux transporter MFP subunit